MALRLVNTAPGDSSDPIKPEDHVHLGLKSEALTVQIGYTKVAAALSGLVHTGLLPEDAGFEKMDAAVDFVSFERLHPLTGVSASRALSVNDLVITKNSNNNGDLSVYEVSVPHISATQSMLGHFKFRKKTWTPYSPLWTNLSNVVGMVFGVEHGPMNTSATVFLQTGNKLVLAGPLQSYLAARPGQTVYTLNWEALSDDEEIELYVLFNSLASPRTVEVWAKLPADPGPVLLGSVLVSSLGQFPTPSSNINNNRAGITDTGKIFFGNAGRTGDVLQIEDWSFYPDFRIVMEDGVAQPNAEAAVLPDCPVEFRASKGLAPEALVPGRWIPDGALLPSAELVYQPGRRSEPVYLTHQKTGLGTSFFRKMEPRVAAEAAGNDDGFMIEAFVAGEVFSRAGDATGLGFEVDDGVSNHRLTFVESDARRTVGILKDQSAAQDLLTGYHLPDIDIDWTSLKLLRMVLDRRRGWLDLYADEALVLHQSLSGITLPPTILPGRVAFGHLESLDTSAKIHTAFLNYLPRYRAWESIDAVAPDASSDPELDFFKTLTGAGSAAFSSGKYQVVKSSVSVASKHTFYRAADFGEFKGGQLDFENQVVMYTDQDLRQFAPQVSTGTGVSIFLGNKKIDIGFYDCGIHGRKVGIIPGSGSAQDIIDQTALGRRFSADVDWTQTNQFRVVVKGFDRIEVYLGSVVNVPIITIPWQNDTDGFDLPNDITAPGFSFGHFSESTTSTTKWGFMRWGVSNGYEVATKMLFPDGLPKYLYGGKVLVRTNFTEG